MKLFDRIRRFLREDDADNTNEYSDDNIEKVSAGNRTENERQNVRDFCEQLVDSVTHMEEAKTEYRIVTEYLSDIQRIEELPVDMAKKLIDTSEQIVRLDKERQTYVESENLLPPEQYNIMSTYEGDIIDTIKKLNEMEMRDSMLKSDMGHLEGEKEDLKYNRLDDADKIEHLRGIIITILVLFLLTSGFLCIYAFMAKTSVTLYALITGAVAMICFAIFYVRYSNLKREINDTDAKVNRAISLLNKVKVKYINNTNALDYIYAKYDINSSKELEYRYELYNTMVRDEKKYYQANSELRVKREELIKQLDSIGVRDSQVWIKQAEALIDRRELVEIKHGLNVRRQSLRDRMSTCEKIRDNACIALRAAIDDNPGMESYIKDILAPYKIKLDN